MQMDLPLGSTPVLDKGYVKLLSASPSGQQISIIRNQVFRGLVKESLTDLPRVVLKIRCPYVVLHHLQSTKIRIINDLSVNKEFVYEPQITDIRSGKHETDVELAEYMSSTLNALVVNQVTLKQDGCNAFIAQLTTPIAAYWEGIAYGDLSDWIRIIVAPHTPPMVKAYQDAFKLTISTEFLELDEFIRRILR